MEEAGVGIVMRDFGGLFVAARSMNLGVVGTLLCADALAGRAAFDFALALAGIGHNCHIGRFATVGKDYSRRVSLSH
ncbi:hypothetical protein RHMOL_Rhmol07G0244200 [Rhododendron molle]|uniref:Uncharacterized protein n=1 Tax=Rhododendron molle TaxID=49168 RepID=A0ACC0N415_RHOML|nr:hypothetical protein RHMOL_Rhmol07G0244200 [Rhododendron molle]